jgi:hypothetical protein
MAVSGLKCGMDDFHRSTRAWYATCTAMDPLSERATTILERMEPNRSYEPSELRALAPEPSIEGLREIMHELWVKRHVERVGYSGWRRDRSTCGSRKPPNSPIASIVESLSYGDDLPPRKTEAVRPEDLFDHDSFSGIFK